MRTAQFITGSVTRNIVNCLVFSLIFLVTQNCFSQSADKKNVPGLPRVFEIANNGNTGAMFAIACMYLKGDGLLNVAKDTTEAIKWLEKAAKAGHITAMNNLAAFLMRRANNSKDSAQAFSWYMSAARLGNTYAMLNIGMHYITGDIVEKNKAEGLKWIIKSAESNNYKAMCILGEMYANEKAVDKDSVKAIYWYKRSAETKLKLKDAEK